MIQSHQLRIGNVRVSSAEPTCFIADIAANHDGELTRAIDLIHLAAQSGADIAKFQHFSAKTIVSDAGFQNLGGQQSHQSKWKKSVFQVYQEASLDQDWTPRLKEECDKAHIEFMTSPYSMELVDHVDPYVSAYKIGSGDITWREIIEHICAKRKPVILATGASTFEEVENAVGWIKTFSNPLVLMQCNTNYCASLENFRYIHLNVLKTYARRWPEAVLGLSDHTPGCATVLGAVALGARVIEKHFTDDTKREGPDHLFSMDPISWTEMVHRTRELEQALGGTVKKVEENESETVVIQRRAIRLSRNLKAGDQISRSDLSVLRPCPQNSIPPSSISEVIGRRIKKSLSFGTALLWEDLEP